MIRFVDLRAADIAGYRFCFWDTVKDRFVEIDGQQAFDDLAELSDYHATSTCPYPLDRLLALMPDWTHHENR